MTTDLVGFCETAFQVDADGYVSKLLLGGSFFHREHALGTSEKERPRFSQA